ncbi:ATP-binding protein [Kocuria nitroreducens]|uniref:ATP-binding protein n=1 Tax=Kocuria nitroreducens TaxID=3058914 RepID=UPI0036DD87A3
MALRRVEAGRDAQSMVLYGLRGVGKTVLLSRFAQLARERGWLVAQIEARSGVTMRDMIGAAFHDDLVDLARPGIGARALKALRTTLSYKASYDSSGTWNFGLDLDQAAGGGADIGSLEADVSKLLRDLAGAAEERDVGVAVLIDEAQDLPHDELIALCSVVHSANQRGSRIVVALTGLPSLPRKLAEAKSYAERLFDCSSIGALDDDAARQAIVEPSQIEDVHWDDAAVDHLVDQARGYPYFLQQYGQDTWNACDHQPITLLDAKVGHTRGQLALDTGFYRIRWDRATSAEKDYLRAMAVDGDEGSASGEVAARLGKKITALGPIRAKLIDKGLIYAPDHGVVAYTVPAMSSFIERQVTDR